VSGFSTYAGRATLGQWFGAVPAPVPGFLYVALLTAGSAELAGNGYARVQVANNSGAFSAPAGAAPEFVSNALVIQFPLATADWVQATQFAIYDAASAGNALWGPSPLGAGVTVLNGQQVQFAIGALVLQLN
jgi:hypothetical protein